MSVCGRSVRCCRARGRFARAPFTASELISVSNCVTLRPSDCAYPLKYLLTTSAGERLALVLHSLCLRRGDHAFPNICPGDSRLRSLVPRSSRKGGSDRAGNYGRRTIRDRCTIDTVAERAARIRRMRAFVIAVFDHGDLRIRIAMGVIGRGNRSCLCCSESRRLEAVLPLEEANAAMR